MEFLYTDANIVVCIKPVGLDAETGMPAALREALGGEFYSVHRLDRNVGGVMVFARTRNAAAVLSRAIQAGTMVKEYVAMVHGTPPDAGDWEDLLWKDSQKNKVYVVHRPRGGVKAARLEYVRITQGAESLVRIRLHTGRTHQIRVQFASRGFPLVGDHKYGAKDFSPVPLLFSCRLTFPLYGTLRSFEALPNWAQFPGAEK